MRAWAEFDPVAFQTVEEVFNKRLDFVRALLSKIGFSGNELEVRTRLFVTYNSWKRAMFGKPGKKVPDTMLKLCHSLLTER